ncbi:MAG TPA: hypothetical protein VMT12_10725 [Syntrophales bacterium]|nr:hypothetical protein [Syntrophales bacterium]
MLRVLDDESAIKKYRRQFIKSFKPFINEKIAVNLGHPGATVKAKVSWSDSLGIWMLHEKISDSRYWHAFGAGKPTGASHIPITCEINFPARGIDRRIGGAMAADRGGRVYVVHRGKIGGGKKGVGKSLFEDHYRGVWTTMEDGPVDTTVALIGILNSPRFVRQVTQFVRKIDTIKNLYSSPSSQLEITFDELCFREELIGASHAQPELDPRFVCDHGLIVKDLYDVLSRRGLKIGNNLEHDLLIANAKGDITIVFRVITDALPESIQSGAGQLLLASTDLQGRPRLILTIPEFIDEILKAKLKKLGIDVLVYEWQRDKAVFPNLPVLIC